MKVYVKSANKLSNKITQLISKKFDENEILVRTILGKHDGDPMLYVFFNIMCDPNVTIENPDVPTGDHEIYLNGKNVGWLNFERGMGWIDDSAYQKIQKQDPAILDQMKNEFISNMFNSASDEEIDDELEIEEDSDDDLGF